MFQFHSGSGKEFLDKDRLHVYLIRKIRKVNVERTQIELRQKVAVVKIGGDISRELGKARLEPETEIKAVVDIIIKIVPDVVAQNHIERRDIVLQQQFLIREVCQDA